MIIQSMANFRVPHTAVHRASRRFLEPAQDLLVLGVGVALFGLMVRTLARLHRELFASILDFRVVVAEVLFMLVMVEVVRLVIIYLQEHRVAVDFMVELGIVATLREIVLRGVIELDWKQIAALSVFLVALGGLLRFGDLRTSLRHCPNTWSRMTRMTQPTPFSPASPEMPDRGAQPPGVVDRPAVIERILALLRPLLNYARAEVRAHEALGDLPPDAVRAEEVVDAALVEARITC